ncbi:MAG: MotA/TolQ/ExbB proton channel family protein [bacterium]|nr:MotA/TolQ/ExbB proton channel family protein [bacterium]
MTEIVRQIPDWLIPALILLISIFAVAIIVDRARLLLGRIKAIKIEEEREVLDLVRAGSLDEAAAYCQQRQHPAFAVAITLIQSGRRGLNLESAAESEAHRTTSYLKRFLQALGTISTIAPLLGLLGTVTGMIKSFHAFDEDKVQNAQLVGGIDEALITTALGLIVAIPTLIAYNYFANRVNQIAAETTLLSDQISEELSRQRETIISGSAVAAERS